MASAGKHSTRPTELPALVQGAALRAVSQGVWRIGAFITGIVLVRTMSLADAGRYFLVLSLGAFFGLLLDLGLFQSLSREVPRMDALGARGAGDERFVTSLKLMAVLGSAVSVAAALAAYFTDIDRVDLLAAALVIGCFIGLQTLASTYLRLRDRRLLAEAYQAVVPILFLGVVATLVLLERIGPAFVIGARLVLEVAAAAALVAAALAISRGSKPSADRRSVLGAALPLWLTGLAWVGLEQADVALLGVIVSDGAVGLYAPVLRLTSLAVLPLGVVFPYIMLISASMAAAGRHRDIQRLYDLAGKAVLVVGAPVMALMFIDPSSVVHLIFDVRSPEVAPAARILTVGFFVHATLGLNTGVAEATVGLRTLARRSLLVLGTVLVVASVLIAGCGILGAALGNAVGYTAVVLVNASLLERSIGLRPITRGMVATAATFVVTTGAGTVLVATFGGWPVMLGAVAVVTGLTVLVAWRTTPAPDRVALRRGFDRRIPNAAGTGGSGPPSTE